MGLDRYEVQARVIADELLELLAPAERKAVQSLLKGPLDYMQMTRPDYDDAIALMSATPAKMRSRWSRASADEKPLLWLRARTLALASAMRLQLTLDVQMIEGAGYREAVRSVAQSILTTPLWPSAEDLLEPAY